MCFGLAWFTAHYYIDTKFYLCRKTPLLRGGFLVSRNLFGGRIPFMQPAPTSSPPTPIHRVFVGGFSPTVVTVLIGVATGLLISFGDWWIALLALVLMRRLAVRPLDYMLGYVAFAVAAWPDIAGGFARQYGHDGPATSLLGLIGLMAWGALLSLPGLFRFDDRRDPRFHVRAVNNALAWLILPWMLAPVVVLHPVMAASELFPATGRVGLIAMALIVVMLGTVSWQYVVGALLALIAVIVSHGDQSLRGPPKAIAAVNAQHFAPFHGQPGRVEQLLTLLGDVRRALDAGARIVITPELTVAAADGTFDGFKEGVARQVADLGAAVWVGTDVQLDGRRHNAMVGIGDTSDTPFVSALVPLPFVMWKPWQALPAWDAGPRWRQTDVGPLTFMICYESVSALAWIERLRGASLGHGTVAFVSSQWWTTSTRPNTVLSRGAKNFARLTGSAYVSAVGR